MRLPRDDNQTPIPVLSQGLAVVGLTTSGSSQAIAVGADKCMTVTCHEDAYIKFGGSGVTASALDWPIYGTEKETFFTEKGQTHMAIIQKTVAGRVCVMQHGADLK